MKKFSELNNDADKVVEASKNKQDFIANLVEETLSIVDGGITGKEVLAEAINKIIKLNDSKTKIEVLESVKLQSYRGGFDFKLIAEAIQTEKENIKLISTVTESVEEVEEVEMIAEGKKEDDCKCGDECDEDCKCECDNCKEEVVEEVVEESIDDIMDEELNESFIAIGGAYLIGGLCAALGLIPVGMGLSSIGDALKGLWNNFKDRGKLKSATQKVKSDPELLKALKAGGKNVDPATKARLEEILSEEELDALTNISANVTATLAKEVGQPQLAMEELNMEEFYGEDLNESLIAAGGAYLALGLCSALGLIPVGMGIEKIGEIAKNVYTNSDVKGLIKTALNKLKKQPKILSLIKKIATKEVDADTKGQLNSMFSDEEINSFKTFATEVKAEVKQAEKVQEALDQSAVSSVKNIVSDYMQEKSDLSSIYEGILLEHHLKTKAEKVEFILKNLEVVNDSIEGEDKEAALKSMKADDIDELYKTIEKSGVTE